MKLNFGKHKGKELIDVPLEYLAWLVHPVLPEDKMFDVPKQIQDEANKLYVMKLIERNYKDWRLNGYPSKEMEYIIERLGDLSGITIHPSLEEALKQLEAEYPNEGGN